MSRTKILSVRSSMAFAVVTAFSAVLMVGGCGGDDSPAGEHTHSWGDWEITTPATCTAPGVETRTCQIDVSHTETKTITQLTGAQCNGDGGPLTFEGQTYRTVIIGGKRWMAENLNYQTSDSSWCYENEPDSCKKYGRLYAWSRAVSACEAIGNGWHLPDTADWNRLVDAAGGLEVAGSKLKSQTGWYDYPGISSTNEFGFSALPGGRRVFVGGSFYNAGGNGYWWSATENDANFAWGRCMYYSNDNVDEHYHNKSNGFSVRCIQDIGN